ncbi:MAG: 4-alpha-glucanotransferase [Deltaproteobacteria bacterium]|nr:4-alpha-glucanotransferase [Deltaproteobacteria bacterium]
MLPSRRSAKASVPGEHMQRSSGVLLHPTSLPGPWGGGDVGPEARRFVQWLRSARQAWWQMLPLGPVDGSGSPYNSPSAFAGSPGLISIDDLIADGLLDAASRSVRELRADAPAGKVDFRFVRERRVPLVRQAALALARDDAGAVEAFAEANAWAVEWAEFAARKAASGDAAWWQWKEQAVSWDDVATELAVQLLFARQWDRLHAAAGDAGVGLIGDIPIFVSADSADVASHRELFLLGAEGRPDVVAGVPPDAFSPTGQKWGMPLYDWEANAQEGFQWWRSRLTGLLERVDLVRIDHFRGFAAAWHVGADEPDAIHGEWVPGPGAALFEALRDACNGELPVIAEDLGVITPAVEDLRDRFGLPGMRILQFAFGGEPNHPFLPHSYPERSVVYTGTHDNQTTAGWWAGIGDDERARVLRYLGGGTGDPSWDLIRLAWDSRAELAIAPMQDLLSLGDEARFNTPGLAEGNWGWRLSEPVAELVAGRLAEVTLRAGRGR